MIWVHLLLVAFRIYRAKVGIGDEIGEIVFLQERHVIAVEPGGNVELHVFKIKETNALVIKVVH